MTACSAIKPEKPSELTDNKNSNSSVVFNHSNTSNEQIQEKQDLVKEKVSENVDFNDPNIVEKTSEARKRIGGLELSNLEIVNVEGELLRSIKTLFEAINKNDEKLRFSLTYDPKHDDVFHDGEYILAFTKLEMDNSRASAVTSEYGLDEIADDVAIVKITSTRLNVDLTEYEGTGDYIFIKDNSDKKWKVYRWQ